MISYGEESFSKIASEIALLIKEHWEEVTATGPALDPDWDAFKALDDIGILHTLAVRSDGLLVGYIILISAFSLHYKTLKTAHDDAFFLKKEYRKGLVGAKMFQAAEEMLAKKQINRVYYHEKKRRPMGKVFQFLGYTATETIWVKDI